MAGWATCCPCFPEKQDRPSASSRPPNPIQARNPTNVETAAGSSTTGYRPGLRSIGRREAAAFVAARRPTASGSTSARVEANVSAKPLPPSSAVTTVVTEAWVEGAQQNWPSVLSNPTSLAPVSNAPEATRPRPHWAISVARSEEHTSELQSPYDLVC